VIKAIGWRTGLAVAAQVGAHNAVSLPAPASAPRPAT
jgi:hypothetical protein